MADAEALAAQERTRAAEQQAQLQEEAERARREVARAEEAAARLKAQHAAELEQVRRDGAAAQDAALEALRSEHEQALMELKIRSDHVAMSLDLIRKEIRDQIEGTRADLARALQDRSARAAAASAALERVSRAAEDRLAAIARDAQGIQDTVAGRPRSKPDAGLVAAETVQLLERMLHESNQKAAELREAHAASCRQGDELRAVVGELEGDVQRLSAALAGAEAAREEASGLSRSLGVEVERLTEELQALQARMGSELSAAEGRRVSDLTQLDSKLQSEISSLSHRLREEQALLQQERELRVAQQADHEAVVAGMQRAMDAKSESAQQAAEGARRQFESIQQDLEREIGRIRQQSRADLEEIQRYWQERAKAAEAEHTAALAQARADGESEGRAEGARLLRAQQGEWEAQQQAAQQQLAALEGELAARQQQLESLQSRYDKLRDLFGPYTEVSDSEFKLTPAEEAALKLVELRTRLDKEVEEGRVLRAEREDLQKEVKKLRGRVERREEDMTILLINVRQVLGIDQDVGMDDGLLSVDKSRFTAALNRLRESLVRQLQRREELAAGEVLRELGGDGDGPGASTTVLKRVRREREQAMATEAAKLRDRIAELQSQLLAGQRELQDAQAALAAQRERGEALDRSLEGARAETLEAHGRQHELQSRLRAQEDEAQRLRDLVGQTEAALQDARRAIEALQQDKGEVEARLNEAVQALGAQSVELDERARQADAQAQAHEEELARVRHEAALAADLGYQEATKPLKAELRRLQDQVNDLTRQYQSDLDARAAESGELQRRVRELQEDVRALQDRAHRLQAQLKEEVAAADQARNERGVLLREREVLEGQVKYLEAKVARGLKDVEALRARLRERETRVSDLMEEVRAVRKAAREQGLGLPPTPAPSTGAASLAATPTGLRGL